MRRLRKSVARAIRYGKYSFKADTTGVRLGAVRPRKRLHPQGRRRVRGGFAADLVAADEEVC